MTTYPYRFLGDTWEGVTLHDTEEEARAALLGNRIFSPDACTVCGRLGDPHAGWCADMTAYLARQNAMEIDET